MDQSPVVQVRIEPLHDRQLFAEQFLLLQFAEA
jgi:hypothetical protein